MNIALSTFKGSRIIQLSGDIDMYSSPELRTELMGLVKKRVTPLYVDFKGVTYIDSSGIATFVEGLKSMKTYNGRLCLFCIPHGIMEIFRFSKLDRVFEIYGNIDDAINS